MLVCEGAGSFAGGRSSLAPSHPGNYSIILSIYVKSIHVNIVHSCFTIT